MRLNGDKLKQNVSDYLHSPAANATYDDFNVSFWQGVGVTALVLFVGMLMVASLIRIGWGLRAIREALRFKVFSSTGDDLRKDPGKLKPLIASSVIIGKQGFGVVLSTFDEKTQEDLDFLARKAEAIATLYSHGSTNPQDRPMIELLRNDTYSPKRRRRVPEPLTEGRELYLFDTKIDVKEAATVYPGSVVAAFVVAPGERGGIVQIPWAVVSSAITE